ncbi:MAG: DUF6377 domain-containing protein [Bacteroidales bacterium]|nr:DUF6377 domain-containing protein [Bacteroidales bacterium]
MKFFSPAALLILAAAVSCGRSPVKETFRELDRTIDDRQLYITLFEKRNDVLRERLRSSGKEDLKWETAERLFQEYVHFNADSAGHYVSLMKAYARGKEQLLRTSLAESRLLGVSHHEDLALMLFNSIDTIGMESMGVTEEYLSTGIRIFTNLSRYSRPSLDTRDYDLDLRAFRNAYIARDTVSYEGRKLLAQHLRDSGDLDGAMRIFLGCYDPDSHDYHKGTSIAYNIAMLYGRRNDVENAMIWLARSAMCDFKAPNRDFLSLYQLSLALYKQGQYTRAGRYIRIHFSDVYAGDFQAQMIQSSTAQNIIVEEAIRAERDKRLVILTFLMLVSVLLVVIGFMLSYASRQARDLSEANAKLGESNSKLAYANKALSKSNKALAEANNIKDNYVFRYMDLSIHYLDKVEEKRAEYRQIAKNKGEEALLKALRSPASFADYKEFYSIFDRTFLGIFPNFVKGVNALLSEEARFDPEECRESLPTELRILATLKLGIEDSPRIASFLKCSLSTVYTYRAKMRNQAVCPKEEFEDRVKALE